MRKSALDGKGLQRVGAWLGEAAVDPALWPNIMEDISAAAGARGAVLLQSDVRTPDIPRTAGVNEMIVRYFAFGWHMRDVRAERGVPLLLSGQHVVTDQDIMSPEEMKRSSYYAELLSPFGLQWFAAIGFRAGPALWAMVLQRTPREGPFSRNDQRVLGFLAQRLTQTATLSHAVGRAVLSSAIDALGLVDRPVLALDRLGFVVEMNAAAEQVFDQEVYVKNRRLCLSDRAAKAALDTFIDRLRTTSDRAVLPVSPIVVRRLAKRPFVIRILPVDGAARTPFLGARALLILSNLSRRSGPQPDSLSDIFGLSHAEARLTSLIASGLSPEQAADELGVAHQTVRTQLKSIFAKTDTHRQSELVALMTRL